METLFLCFAVGVCNLVDLEYLAKLALAILDQLAHFVHRVASSNAEDFLAQFVPARVNLFSVGNLYDRRSDDGGRGAKPEVRLTMT